MENRETIIIETPKQKQKVELKTWLTGGEKRSITNSLLKGAEFTQDELQNPTIKGESVSEMQDNTIKAIVVSVDEKTENVLQTILDMRSEDFDFVVEEINKITNAEDSAIKK